MKPRFAVVIAVVALVALCFVAVQVVAAEKPETGKETKISLKQLPKAVRATLLKEAKGGKIDEIEKCVNKGVVTYSADVTKGGKSFDVEIDATGKLIKMEEEKPGEERNKAGEKCEGKEAGEPSNEVEVEFDDLPAAVQTTIKNWAGSTGKIGEVEKGILDGKPVFSADVTKDGNSYDVIVAPDGKFIKASIDTATKAGTKDTEAGEKGEKGEKGEAGEKD
jgi:hypothetical protein